MDCREASRAHLTPTAATAALLALGDDEQQALSALAGSGLVPPLRLVPHTRPVRSVPAPVQEDWADWQIL